MDDADEAQPRAEVLDVVRADEANHYTWGPGADGWRLGAGDGVEVPPGVPHLIGERDHTAGELAAAFALGKPTVSHHLALLRQAGLVSAHKEGQSVRYRLEATVLDECLGWFLKLIERSKHPRSRPTHENTPLPAPGISPTDLARAAVRPRRRVVG